MKKYVVGTDIGGSHISAILVNMQSNSIVPGSFSSRTVDNHAPARSILSQWGSAILDSLAFIDRNELAGIGFAMPGPFDYVNGIGLFEGNEKYENLKGINVTTWLKNMLNIDAAIGLRFMNDATCFAVGEAWIGETSGVKRSVAITLGTGFGSAFIESGIPVIEGSHVPEKGCVWHLPYKHGIADEYFSTRWFERQYTCRSGRKIEGVKELAEMASFDPIANQVFIDFGENLGEFLNPWLSAFEADSLVIGGNIAGAYPLFETAFKTRLYAQGMKIDISTSRLKESATMVGSARMFDNDFWTKVNPLLSKM